MLPTANLPFTSFATVQGLEGLAFSFGVPAAAAGAHRGNFLATASLFESFGDFVTEVEGGEPGGEGTDKRPGVVAGGWHGFFGESEGLWVGSSRFGVGGLFCAGSLFGFGSLLLGRGKFGSKGGNVAVLFVETGIVEFLFFLNGSEVGWERKVHLFKLGELVGLEDLKVSKDGDTIISVVDVWFVNFLPILHARAEGSITIGLAKFLEGCDEEVMVGCSVMGS